MPTMPKASQYEFKVKLPFLTYRLIQEKKLDARDVLVYLSITGDKNGFLKSERSISVSTGLSRSVIQKAIARLEKEKLVSTIREFRVDKVKINGKIVERTNRYYRFSNLVPFFTKQANTGQKFRFVLKFILDLKTSAKDFELTRREKYKLETRKGEQLTSIDTCVFIFYLSRNPAKHKVNFTRDSAKAGISRKVFVKSFRKLQELRFLRMSQSTRHFAFSTDHVYDFVKRRNGLLGAMQSPKVAHGIMEDHCLSEMDLSIFRLKVEEEPSFSKLRGYRVEVHNFFDAGQITEEQKDWLFDLIAAKEKDPL